MGRKRKEKKIQSQKMVIGVPIKLLHEAEGHIVTVELNNGELYRGTLVEAEDSMNLRMANIVHTARNGQTRTDLSHVYVRGSEIRFMILPDMLKNALCSQFQKIKEKDWEEEEHLVVDELLLFVMQNSNIKLI